MRESVFALMGWNRGLASRCLVVMLPVWVTSSARGQTPVCNELAGQVKEQAASLLASEHPYECCTDTIAKCLQADQVCPLARRLAQNVCRRVAKGQDPSAISRVLAQRARSMVRVPGPQARIDLHGATPIGQRDAAVTLVEYACGRCPFCAKITRALATAVKTGGPLAGKASLYLRIFPLRGHEGAKELGLAFLAAEAQGRFWDYVSFAYERFDEFSPGQPVAWALALGLDGARFRQDLQNTELAEQLVASKKEGLANGVDATPTIFINGRMYLGELTVEELVDVVEEEYERMRKLPASGTAAAGVALGGRSKDDPGTSGASGVRGDPVPTTP